MPSARRNNITTRFGYLQVVILQISRFYFLHEVEGIFLDIVLERILSLLPHKPDGKLAHGARRELAEKLGLTNGNLVSNWIAGRSSSYMGYLYQIAGIYGVSVEWLKGETDEKTPTAQSSDGLTPLQRELIAALPHLSDDAVATLLFAAKGYLGLREDLRKVQDAPK